jgi:L-ornithine N5-oxygenase
MSQLPVYDVVGIGFGPSNLALAIALTESGGSLDGIFLERQPRFGWHRGMLLDDATMQVSFLKDLVTLRNPGSEFTFLRYLHSKGRLIDFINHKNLFPLRVEFHDYLEWAAARVEDQVRYGHEVVAVEPVSGADGIDLVEVRARAEGREAVYLARNLVFATGLRPCVPDGVTVTDRIWHNSDLLDRLAGLSDEPRRFVVVGAGQSAAEVAGHLHQRYPSAEVCAVFSRYGYSPADDSSFANRIFDPAAVGEFYDAPQDVKQALVDYHGNTNYSVVDVDLIADLYRRVYREKVLGEQRLRLFNVSRVVEAVETGGFGTGGGKVEVTVESLATGTKSVLDADVVIYATGYQPADPAHLLGGLARYCRQDERGRLRVARDYRVVTAPELRAGVYLQGGTEHTHGITSSLLSNTAVRVADILGSIVDRQPAAVGRP